jgi:hypothetical protein
LPGRRRRLDAAERHVHRGLDEGVIKRRVALQQPVIERPVNEVERHLEIEARRDLASLDGPREDGPGLVAARLDDALLVFGGKGGVGVRLGEQGGDHPRVGSLAADQPGPGRQEFNQVTTERSSVPRVGCGGAPLGVQGVQGEAFLGRPPAVDRGLADPGPRGHRVHADRVEAVLEQQADGGLEDRLMRPRAARPPARRRFRECGGRLGASLLPHGAHLFETELSVSHSDRAGR